MERVDRVIALMWPGYAQEHHLTESRQTETTAASGRKNGKTNSKKNETIKIENLNYINFYAKKSRRGISSNIPVIQIFNMEKNIFTEMKVKISDYILLKMYFEKYKVMVSDDFKMF